ncbi:MAG TPA: hypothetical protein ENF87_03095, partial [Thermoproteales archaeon]|nr:hypothetical protein [Thermoproteales archaeon]
MYTVIYLNKKSFYRDPFSGLPLYRLVEEELKKWIKPRKIVYWATEKLPATTIKSLKEVEGSIREDLLIIRGDVYPTGLPIKLHLDYTMLLKSNNIPVAIYVKNLKKDVLKAKNFEELLNDPYHVEEELGDVFRIVSLRSDLSRYTLLREKNVVSELKKRGINVEEAIIRLDPRTVIEDNVVLKGFIVAWGESFIGSGSYLEDTVLVDAKLLGGRVYNSFIVKAKVENDLFNSWIVEGRTGKIHSPSKVVDEFILVDKKLKERFEEEATIDPKALIYVDEDFINKFENNEVKFSPSTLFSGTVFLKGLIRLGSWTTVIDSFLEDVEDSGNTFIVKSVSRRLYSEGHAYVAGRVIGQVIEEEYPNADLIYFPSLIKVENLIKLLKEDPSILKLYYDREEVECARKRIQEALQWFIKIFGADREVVIARVPGRVNLMGRHVDHRKCCVNPIAINREVVVVASPRNDYIVNAYSVGYGLRSFDLREVIPPRPIKTIEEWRKWTGQVVQEVIKKGRMGDWENYLKTISYLQNYYWRSWGFLRKLKGMDLVFNGNIPPGSGLSSSSAMVIATYLVAIALNRLRISRRRLVELAGIGEWYVGTRGGWGDHAAMLFAKRGKVTRICFEPLKVSYAPFPENLRVVICNSLKKASKTAGARSIFNERVATYEIGFMYLLKRFPNIKDKVKFLRDFNTRNFKTWEIYEMLLALPERASRKRILEDLPEYREKLLQIFSEHEEPEKGYDIRGVLIFGISECERSRIFTDFLRRGLLKEIGELIKVSHNGDRVVVHEGDKVREWNVSYGDEDLKKLIELAKGGDKSAELYLQPGRYSCSIPEIDYMVDVLDRIEGVYGAQLVGAGLGGCLIALVEKNCIEEVKQVLWEKYYKSRIDDI